jgi:hypothetical protein
MSVICFLAGQYPFDRIAFLAARWRVDELEHLLEPFNLALGLFAMGFKCILELAVTCLLDHGRKGFHDMLLGIVNVLEGWA